MEHSQRVWHTSRERLLLRTPGSVPIFWYLLGLQLLDKISQTCRVFARFFHIEYLSVLDFAFDVDLQGRYNISNIYMYMVTLKIDQISEQYQLWRNMKWAYSWSLALEDFRYWWP